jgi:hypothetical protein
MAGFTTPAPAALIPGAYERNTLTHRQSGSMGGPAFGSPTAPGRDETLSAATILDREREGGGGPSQRPPRTAPARGRAVAMERSDHIAGLIGAGMLIAAIAVAVIVAFWR